MAAPKENLLSLGHLTGTERNTFTKQREQSLKKSINRPMLSQTDFSVLQSQHLRATHLQQRWQELKERELTAQQHNRQLLQQFEEAQDTLRDMLSLTSAMKTIRVEYERYLEESAPHWQRQLKEKTQAAQKKRMEEYLRSCLKNTEEQRGTNSSADRPLLSQAPTTKPDNIAPPQMHYSRNSHLDYNQDGSPHLPYMQSSWQNHPQSQMARFPIRMPHHPQGSSYVPPSFLPPPIFPNPFQLPPHAPTPSHHHPWTRQNPPAWASPQPDNPWSWTALWGQLCTEEPPPERGVAQVVGEGAETSRAPSSKRERGGGSRSSHLCQELDIKPVRLSSSHAQSSESSRESSQASREKRKKREKRGRARCTSSDRERHSAQESAGTSGAIVTTAVTVAQSSESDTSSEKGRSSTRRMRRSGELAVGSPRAEKVEEGRSEGDDSRSHKEESQSTGEELGRPIEESRSEKAADGSPEDKSESCREESESQREEESGSVSVKVENGGRDEIEMQEGSISEQSSIGEKDEEEHEKDLGDGEDYHGEKEDSQRDEEQEERDVEDDGEASERNSTTEEEEEAGAEDEMEESDSLKNEDVENGKQVSACSQEEEVDEDESEGGEDKMEDGESDEEYGAGVEEQQRRDKEEAEEERDSEDSIVSPQDKCKKLHIIPEVASEYDEDDEGCKTGSSDGDSNEISDEDDVEHLLAPQDQSQKKEGTDLGADNKPKAISDMVEIFQVERDTSTNTDHPSDSDEFYD